MVVIVILGREIAVSALREWMAEIGSRKSVAVSVVGKFKTASQMLATPTPAMMPSPPMRGVGVTCSERTLG